MLKTLRNNFQLHFFAKVLIPLVLALFFFSSCGSYENIEFGKVNDFRMNQKSNGKMELVMKVSINNPNNFNIKVIKSEFNLEIGGNNAGKITLSEKVKIKKNKDEEYEVVVEADKGDVTAAMMKTAFSSLASKKVQLKAKGWVKGRVFIFGKKEEVDFNHEFNLDDIKLSQGFSPVYK